MRYRFLRFPGGKEKAVTLSYDDGKPDDIRFSEIISGYGLKCTFNLNCKKQRDVFLTDEQVRTYFLEKGHEIAVHGALHKAEGCIRPIEGITDILECRQELEKRFGMIIKGMAYPDTGINLFSNNASYESVRNYLKELDIVYARTIDGDNNSFMLPDDWYSWVPTAHHGNPQIMEYIDEFNSIDLLKSTFMPGRAPRLFYMWGHSFEFERAGNWDLLEKICSKLGGKDDVWYATNIEIYDYVNAYNNLSYSADGTIIYNPALFEIWLDIDGVTYSIAPGETLKLIS